jgi:hypothetical protein
LCKRAEVIEGTKETSFTGWAATTPATASGKTEVQDFGNISSKNARTYTSIWQEKSAPVAEI